jgi:hypothetical protein
VYEGLLPVIARLEVYVSIRQDTSAYVSIRQHKSITAYVYDNIHLLPVIARLEELITSEALSY